jgi:hypothetical protein
MIDILLIPCGTKVQINQSNIEGYVSAITIRYNSVVYEVTFIIGVEINREWFYEEQFTTIEKQELNSKKQVGFKTK